MIDNMINLKDFNIFDLQFELVNNTLVYREYNAQTRTRKLVCIFHTHRSWYIRTRHIQRGYDAYARTYSIGLNLEKYLELNEGWLLHGEFKHSPNDCGVAVAGCDDNALYDFYELNKVGGLGEGRNEIELPIDEETGDYKMSEEVFIVMTNKTFEEAKLAYQQKQQELRSKRRERRRSIGSIKWRII